MVSGGPRPPQETVVDGVLLLLYFSQYRPVDLFRDFGERITIGHMNNLWFNII